MRFAPPFCRHFTVVTWPSENGPPRTAANTRDDRGSPPQPPTKNQSNSYSLCLNHQGQRLRHRFFSPSSKRPVHVAYQLSPNPRASNMISLKSFLGTSRYPSARQQFRLRKRPCASTNRGAVSLDLLVDADYVIVRVASPTTIASVPVTPPAPSCRWLRDQSDRRLPSSASVQR